MNMPIIPNNNSYTAPTLDKIQNRWEQNKALSIEDSKNKRIRFIISVVFFNILMGTVVGLSASVVVFPPAAVPAIIAIITACAIGCLLMGIVTFQSPGHLSCHKPHIALKLCQELPKKNLNELAKESEHPKFFDNLLDFERYGIITSQQIDALEEILIGYKEYKISKAKKGNQQPLLLKQKMEVTKKEFEEWHDDFEKSLEELKQYLLANYFEEMKKHYQEYIRYDEEKPFRLDHNLVDPREWNRKYLKSNNEITARS